LWARKRAAGKVASEPQRCGPDHWSLHDHGDLGTVETGSKPLFRIGVLCGLSAAGEGNRDGRMPAWI
jgi:hypothetical protein